MIDAVQSFLAAALAAEPASIEGLARALDLLALAYDEVPEVYTSTEFQEGPEWDYADVRRQVEKRFPDFGIYAVIDPLAVLPEIPLVGDAIDDIADITKDLSDVLWRNDALGLKEAQWEFKFGYETHWGRHLHDLRSYIYAKQFS